MSVENGELPQGWATATVGDLIELNYGKSLPAKKRDNEGFPVYGSNGVIGKHSAPLLNGPAILVGRKGSIGEVHLCKGPCSAIDTTYFVDEFYGQPIDYWYFRLKALPLANLNRATALPGLNRQDAYNLSIKLPPLAEQRRIVAKIEALQERSRRAREALAEVKPLLEQFRQSVLAAAFRGDLTADWRKQNPDAEPASELLERIRKERRQKWEQSELAKYEAKGKKPPKNWQDKYKEPEPVDDSELPNLPDGWCWTRSEEVCEYITKGTTPPKNKMTQYDGDVRFLKVGNLTFTGALNFTKENTYIDAETHNTGVYSRSRIYPGDVLMNLVGPPLGKVSLIPPELEQSNVNQAIAIFRPVNGLRGRYLMLALTTPSILERIISRAKQTSGQRNLTLELSRGLPVPLAPTNEQSEIIRLAQVSLDLIESLETTLFDSESELTQLDQSILAKAFRGELVPQDPNDEPASNLLTRIRQQRESSKPKKNTNKKRKTSNKVS